MSIGEEQVECPLCMEPLELDDLNFFPCTCGYQICRFCWHRIRTDENGLCPACRKAYPEDPAEFKPLTEDEFSCHRLQRIKRERKVKDLQRKQKAAENRKHLANVRVVQKNLVFVVGLSQRLGDTEVLKKHDYFGKFGKIVKVVINQSTSYAGSSGPSASAYITYQKPEDALRAIQAVNNIHVDGRTLKASLGTTKYCSHFLRGTQCPKGDCMYLHELGDEMASFTKDEMQQGKHQEYEQKLYETYMNHLNSVNLATNQNTTTSTAQTATKQNTSTSRKKSSSPAPTQRQTPPLSGSQNSPHNTADAWPSLNTGPGGRQTTDRQPGHTRTGSQDLHRHTPDSQRPSPQLDTCSTSSSSSSSHSNSSSQPSSRSPPQISPPEPSSSPHTQQQNGTQIPPVTATDSQSLHRHTHNSIHTQGPTVSRKPLYGDASDNMSLFSSSGFPVTRNPSKPPMVSLLATTQTQLPTSITNTDTNTDSASSNRQTPPANSSNQQQPHQAPTNTNTGSQQVLSGNSTDPTTHHQAIPDTISVSSATDWQAAFGFQPSTLATQQQQQQQQSQLLGLMNNPAMNNVLGQSSSSSHLLTDGADDDLGFDPWNESTKALQDLIESESVNKHQQHQTTFQQQSMNHIPQQNSVQNVNHLNSLQQQSLLDRTKPLPPGFTPNHITGAFNHNPLLGGSRMMNLMKIPPPQQQNPSQYDMTELTNPQQAHQQQQQSLHNSDPFNMKSWQEGLRALFPANVNIHFGLPSSGAGGINHLQQQQQQLASQQQQQQQQQMGGMMGQMQQQQQQQQHQQQQNIPPLQSLQMNSRQNSIQTQQHTHNTQYSWDFDPAILTVSGNMTGDTNSLLDEPHWMASLHHLTEEPANQNTSNNKFLPNSAAHHLASHHHNNLTHHSSSAAATLGLKQLHHNAAAAFAASGGAPPPQGAPAPPPGFQNTLRPPPQMATTGLEAHKLIDGFQ